MLSADELIWNQPAPLVTVWPSLKRARGQPGLRRRLQHRDAARIVGRDRPDVHRTVAAVMVAGPVVGLQALDQRPAVGRAPALAAHRRPLVEVLLRRPERDAGVVRRAPAEHLRARVAHEAVASGLRLDRVIPVVARVEQVHPVLEAQDPRVVDVRRARLQKAYGDVRILGQPGRDHTARGSAAGDHIVELAGVDHGAISPIAGRWSRSGALARCSSSTSRRLLGLHREVVDRADDHDRADEQERRPLPVPVRLSDEL